MKDIAPSYREKDFLLALLHEYCEKHGDEIRHLNLFEFHSLNISNDLAIHFPEFLPEKRDSYSSTFEPWFEEAVARGHVIDKTGNKLIYHFSDAGYQKALALKNPVKTFCKAHWKFLLPVSLTFISVTIAIIRLTKC
jgi:hypothetical protein